MPENCFWKDLYEAEVKRTAKANFTVGWLRSCLSQHVGNKEANNEQTLAEAKAAEIFG